MRIEIDQKTQKNLRKLKMSNQATSQKVNKVLRIMSEDPWDPQLETTKYISYGQFSRASKADRIWHTRVSASGEAWRVYWRHQVDGDESVIDILHIGPHLKAA